MRKLKLITLEYCSRVFDIDMDKHILRLLGIIFLLSFYGCNEEKSQHLIGNNVQITGKLEGLPDGTLYLIKTLHQSAILDSSATVGGAFAFHFIADSADLYAQVTLVHIDEVKTRREFSFVTNKKYNGHPNSVQSFLLEDGIAINSRLRDFRPLGFKLPDNFKILEALDSISGGKQTWVYYNVTPVFPNASASQDSLVMHDLEQTVLKYPYSLYLLDEIQKNVATLSNNSLKSLLALFDKEVRSTKKWRHLKAISEDQNLIRSNKVLNIYLKNEKDENELLTYGSDNVNTLIVFWASWCQPCLKEIPELKVLFGSGRKIKIISISVDTDKTAWHEMLKKQQMPWKQLIASDKETQEKLFFKYKANGDLPTVVFISKSGKILGLKVGFDPNEKLLDFINRYDAKL